MVRNAVIAAALAIGGLALAGGAPASAVETTLKSGASAAAMNADIMTVGRRWRGGRGYYRGGRGWGYRGGYRRGYWGPGFGIYVAPRPRYYGYRSCWIDRWGYRRCRY